ncbi:MAG: hypothetical protein H7Y59_12200 [Anaerolineales bacterium]|nr:hypothetical protein [Anaerolineales bacterium]
MSTVSGLFDRYSDAEWALEALGIYGVDNGQISVVARGSKIVSLKSAVEQFLEMGFTEEDAMFYAEGVKRGGFLISVTIDSEDEYLVRGILRGAGAVDMNASRKIKQYGSAYVLNSNAYV